MPRHCLNYFRVLNPYLRFRITITIITREILILFLIKGRFSIEQTALDLESEGLGSSYESTTYRLCDCGADI